MDACPDLKRLDIETETVARLPFDKLLSRFSFLGGLDIACKWIERLKMISSHKLRRLQQYNCDMLVEVQIDSPYLFSLEYEGTVHPSNLIDINAPCPWYLKFLLIFNTTIYDSLWFIKLKELLSKSNQAVYLHIWVEREKPYLFLLSSSQAGKAILFSSCNHVQK